MNADALPVSSHRSDRLFYVVTAVVSLAALSLLGWLLLVHKTEPTASGALGFMPAVNASLNATSAVLLSAGFVFIRKRRRDVHQKLMVAAFATSVLFLAGYLAYHYVHGDTRFLGQGAIRPIYFFILISHIVLSAVVLPMILVTFWFAFRGSFKRHRPLARFTLPVWLYVSVTGVVIFFMLRAYS